MGIPRTVCGSILVLALSFVSSLAHATTISETRLFAATNSRSAIVAFPKFDTSLGILNSIRFTLGSDFFGDFDNFGSGGEIDPGGTYELLGHHEARGKATILPLGSPPQFGFSFVMPGDLGCTETNTGNVPAFLACDSLNYGGGAYDDAFMVDPADHGLFLGSSPFDPFFDTFDVEFQAEVDADCTANVGSCGVVSEIRWGGTLQRGQLTVEYTFNEGPPNGVPEPTTLLLLSLGLAGLGLARKRLH